MKLSITQKIVLYDMIRSNNSDNNNNNNNNTTKQPQHSKTWLKFQEYSWSKDSVGNIWFVKFSKVLKNLIFSCSLMLESHKTNCWILIVGPTRLSPKKISHYVGLESNILKFMCLNCVVKFLTLGRPCEHYLPWAPNFPALSILG